MSSPLIPTPLLQLVQWQREGCSTLPFRVRFVVSPPAHCDGAAGLWQSSFETHGRDHSCERPTRGPLNSNLTTSGQLTNVSRSNASASEESEMGSERALVIGTQNGFMCFFSSCHPLSCQCHDKQESASLFSVLIFASMVDELIKGK